jgi:hypothetical protein
MKEKLHIQPLKIPLKCDEFSTCNIAQDSEMANLIRNAELFIWDEAPMMSKHVYDTVDKTFRDVLKCPNIPFGGKVIVFGGDFRQLMPIIKHGNRSRVVASSINKSKFWKSVKILKLNINMRAKLSKLNKQEIQDFSDYLIKIGEGKENIIDNTECLIQLPNDMCLEYDKDN